MTPEPLLSVGLFVYNGGAFIKESLESLLQQTFRDFELIISDNGSTDRTQEICEQYARADSRIRYYRQPVNMGAGWNIRRVFELGHGQYFKWAACDDLCSPDFFMKCIDPLRRDSSLVLTYSRTRVIDQRGNFIENYDWPMRTDSDDPVIRYRDTLLNDHMCYQIFGVMRRDALLQLPPQGSYVNSDGILLSQLSFLGKFYEVPEYIFTSRRHQAQSSKTVPVRVKGRRFRLTDRFCTLPCPEWWDPQKATRVTFPEWRQLQEQILAIVNAPIAPRQKVQAFALLAPWIVKHFRRMMKDLVVAADQVLYNVQMSRLSAKTDLKEVEGKSA
ncbi:MAG TPA: glycosyltransferase family 2 protein [Edaphobacter sp.]|nr:glycosyltransferase family 2 protein [Edaphobacter sp.]